MALAGISTEKLKKYTTKEDLRLVSKWGLVNLGKLSRGTLPHQSCIIT